MLSRSVRISLLQTELTTIVMEDFIHFLQSKKQWFKICFLGFIMIKKCCGYDVAAFAKLSHVTLYARTATDGNMSVVEKGFFAVATY